ncbi:hypothetical protein [Ferroplasma sp.]|uniref:hypothetical protein n=1 Tax=Ferroplasma sp. TaxID=2591003 RepID=UPI00307F68B0
MINYDELEGMMANVDFKYFTFISDNREIFKGLSSKMKETSNFFAMQKLVNKISVDEYTNRSLQKVEQDGNVVIEREIETPKYKFIRNGIFNSIDQAMPLLTDGSIISVLIDSSNTFSSLCNDLSSKGILFLHVKYSNGKFHINGRDFISFSKFRKFLMENYYP